MSQTATERLRKLLDERSIKWWEDAWKPDRITEWNSKYGTVCAATSWKTMGNEWLHLCFYSLTPEEVIAATMGSMSTTVDDVLSLLDEMNEQGRIEYADYSQLHDAITAMLGKHARRD